MVKSVKTAQEVLIQMANPLSEIPLNRENRNKIFDENDTFWPNISIIINILEEIVCCIKVVKMDSSNVSIVPHLFNKILNSYSHEFNSLLSQNDVSHDLLLVEN